jgi:epsilon-lactone hydrolase
MFAEPQCGLTGVPAANFVGDLSGDAANVLGAERIWQRCEMSYSRSVRTRLLQPMLPTAKIAATGEQARRRVAYRRSGPDPIPQPPPLGRRVRVETHTVGEWPIYRLGPESASASAHIIYLYGGAYVLQPQRRHWNIAAQLATNVPAVCDVPIYPLAPERTADQTIPELAAYINRVIVENVDVPVFLAGDCAGAAMALVVAQFLRDRAIRKPAGLVLISPWVDASLAAAPADPAENDSIPGLIAAAHAYAGALELTNPLISPCRGDINGLPPTLMFSGTADLFDRAIQDFARAAITAGVSLELQIGADMAHGYPLLPLLPEAARARRHIVAWLRWQADNWRKHSSAAGGPSGYLVDKSSTEKG